MIFLLSGHCNSCGQRPTVKRVLSRSSSSRSSAKFTSIGRMDIFYVVFNGHKMYIAQISTQFRTCSNSVKSALEYEGVVIISLLFPSSRRIFKQLSMLPSFEDCRVVLFVINGYDPRGFVYLESFGNARANGKLPFQLPHIPKYRNTKTTLLNS